MKQVQSTLYALNKDKSFQEWKVFTVGDTVVVEFGKLGGKIQQKTTVCQPKNIGRANETTAEQQAHAEAVSKWEKQVRLGYRESTDQLEVEENLSPMLAQDALKRPNAIIYPCYAQPKLDGVRCLVIMKDGVPTFNSRGNKLYPVKGPLLDQVTTLADVSGFDKFDAELYLHGLSLQKIVSLAKKWRTKEEIAAEIRKDYEGELKRRGKAIESGLPTYKTSDGDEVPVAVEPVEDVDRFGGYCSYDLELHIFDVPVNAHSPWFDPDSNCHRYADVTTVADTLDDIVCEGLIAKAANKIRVVNGMFVKSEEEAKVNIGINMEDGYEGSIFRNFRGVYEFGQRSNDLVKWKIFFTAEAKILSSLEDKNGEGVLQCITKEGKVFGCKIKGTHAERSQARSLKRVGLFITFSYQALTDDGIPQFPVGQYMREVNPETWEPLE